MKTIRNWAIAALVATTIGACSGSGALNVQVPGLQQYLESLGSASAKTSLETTKTDTTVVAQTATDLTPYRCEFDATVKAWIVYYYSPSKQKSYVCRPKADKTVTVTEVTDANLVYQEGDTIDTTKVTVDAKQASQTAVTNITNNTTVNNNTNVTINNVTLVSPAEAKKKHNRDAVNPVYIVQVNNNQQVFIDASTGQTLNMGGTTPSAMPSTMPSASAMPSTMPSASAMPSAMPSASAMPSTMPSASPSAAM